MAGRRRPRWAGPLRRRGRRARAPGRGPGRPASGRRPRRRHPGGAPAPTRRPRGGPSRDARGLRLAAAARPALRPRGVTRPHGAGDAGRRVAGRRDRRSLRRGSTRWSGWPPTRSGWATRPGRSGCSPPRRPRWRPTRPGGPRPGPAGCGPSWPSCAAGPQPPSRRPRRRWRPPVAVGHGGTCSSPGSCSPSRRSAAGVMTARGRRHRVGRRRRRVRAGWGCYRCAGLRVSPRST